MTLKKFLTILLLVILVAGLIFFLYYLFILKPSGDSLNPFDNSPGDLFPFGNGGDGVEEGGEGGNDGGGGTTTDPGVGENFVYGRISDGPVSGANWINISTTTEDIYYVDRLSGNIFDYSIEKNSSARITNTTLPGLEKAVISKSLSLIGQKTYNSSVIDTFIAYIYKDNGEVLYPSSLESDTKLVALSPNKEMLVYVRNTTNGSAFYLVDLQTDALERIYSSKLQSFLIEWINDADLLIQTKPSYLIEGVSFILNTETGVIKRLLGSKLALLVRVSPSKNFTLYYEQTNLGDSGLYINNKKEGSSTKLSVYTLPEKCIFDKEETFLWCAVPSTVKKSGFPDNWYKGTISFDDRLVKVDLDDYSVTTYLNPTSIGEEVVDMTDISFNSDETFLFFTNKKDLTLWGLRLDN